MSGKSEKPDPTGYNYGSISSLFLMADRSISPVPTNTEFSDLTIMSGKSGNPIGYNYRAISSLLLTVDRSEFPRRDKEPDSAPTCTAGRIDPKEMAQTGSKAIDLHQKTSTRKKEPATSRNRQKK